MSEVIRSERGQAVLISLRNGPGDSRGQDAGPVRGLGSRFEAEKAIAPARWQECRADVLHDLRRTTPDRGLSSAGRASALQAEGHRFDPDRLHQMKVASGGARFAGLRPWVLRLPRAGALGTCIKRLHWCLLPRRRRGRHVGR